VLGAHKVCDGDVLLALASSGCHSNGYSLLRKVFATDLDDWAQELLTPTALYVKAAKALQKVAELHAFAHITGGGMDNLPRILPKGFVARLENWQWPEIFL